MDDATNILSQNQRRERVRRAALPLFVLALLEAAVATLVTALLAHGALRVTLFVVWGTIPLVVGGVLLRSLRAQHRLTPSPVPPLRPPRERLSARREEIFLGPLPSRPAAVLPGGPAITLSGVARSFGSFRAVDGLDLAIRRGEIYGFLGANGAGKTTTIQMMVGLLAPDSGTVAIDGHDIVREPLAARAAFGYVPDRPLLYDRLTGRELLGFLAQLRRLPLAVAEERIAELLAAVDLTAAADRLCGTYSLGMKRKLSLAAALLSRPQVLILDEPFNGLDPKGARRLKDLLVDLAAEGVGVFLSTHDLATAEAVCHRVGILHRGRLMIEGSAEELRGRVAGAPDLEAAFLELTEETPLEAAV